VFSCCFVFAIFLLFAWQNIIASSSLISSTSNSQVTGCEDRLRNDLYCVGWGVKLYSIQCQNLVKGE